MKATAHVHGPAGDHRSGSLMGKLRKRGVLGALAAFLGSGWLLYEIVHFILVDHYGLPERLKDITIVSVLAAALSTVSWRWFRGSGRIRRRTWEYVLIAVIVVVAASLNVSYIIRLDDHTGETGGELPVPAAWKNSIAVLPFVNIGADAEQDYFCDGLTEELINRLSQVPGLKVTARTSAFVFKGRTEDIREVGRRLGVRNVLEGSVRSEGARLRISAQLISAADGFHLWSEAYDRDRDRILEIQDDIALKVARTLKLALLSDPTPLLETENLQAYDEFLQGQSFYRNPTRPNLENAVTHYSRAIALDPRYARAWAGLAGAQAMQAGFGFVPVDVGFPSAKLSVERALALDDRLAFAYSVKGWILMSYDWDWKGADAAYSRNLELEPGSPPLGAAQLALAFGRFDRAIALARRAAEVNSLDATSHMNLALALFYASRLEEAAEAFSTVISLSPDRSNAHSLLAQVYLLQGLPAKALLEAEKESQAVIRLPAQSMAYQALGRTQEAFDALSTFIEDYASGNAYQVAQAYAFFGDPSRAFAWLDRAFADRDGGLFLLRADPFFKAIRTETRFSALLYKMGFSPQLEPH